MYHEDTRTLSEIYKMLFAGNCGGKGTGVGSEMKGRNKTGVFGDLRAPF